MDQRIVCFVWREGTVESYVALQAAAGGGWNLPQGLRAPNEKLEDAARKIVADAIGAQVESLGIVDSSNSETVYWGFSVVGQAPDEGPHGRIEFMLPNDAISLLPSLADRITLREQLRETSYAPRSLGFFERQALELSGQKASYNQLIRNLSNAWAEQRSIESANKRAAAQATFDEIRSELRSVESLAVKDTSAAWGVLKRAKRRQLKVMSDEQLWAQWAIIEAEANQKLGQWRMNAKVKLGLRDEAAEVKQHMLPPVEVMIAVAELLDGYHDGFFDRAQLVRERLTSASLALVLMLVICEAFLVPTLVSALAGTEHKTIEALTGILYAAPFLGAIGAICSGMVSSLGSNAGKRPQAILENTMQAARMILGAGSGFAAVLLLARTLDNPSLLAAVAFAAGTSERFIPSQVEKLLGDSGRQI